VVAVVAQPPKVVSVVMLQAKLVGRPVRQVQVRLRLVLGSMV